MFPEILTIESIDKNLGIAECQDLDENCYTIELSKISENAKINDCIVLNGEIYVVDEKKTLELKAEISELYSKIFDEE